MELTNDLYVLQDGTHAAPGACSAGKDGVLRHKNGLAVAMREDGEPQTVLTDAERNMNVAAVKAGEDGVAAAVVAGAEVASVSEPVRASVRAPVVKAKKD